MPSFYFCRFFISLQLDVVAHAEAPFWESILHIFVVVISLLPAPLVQYQSFSWRAKARAFLYYKHQLNPTVNFWENAVLFFGLSYIVLSHFSRYTTFSFIYFTCDPNHWPTSHFEVGQARSCRERNSEQPCPKVLW